METASFPRRLMAYNLDLTILMVVILSISFFIDDNFILYVIILVTVLVYHASFESSVWQATPGKKYGKLKVESDHGHRLSFLQALCRVACKFISLFLLFTGFFMIYFRQDRKGLHDLICGTKVKYMGKRDS